MVTKRPTMEAALTSHHKTLVRRPAVFKGAHNASWATKHANAVFFAQLNHPGVLCAAYKQSYGQKTRNNSLSHSLSLSPTLSLSQLKLTSSHFHRTQPASSSLSTSGSFRWRFSTCPAISRTSEQHTHAQKMPVTFASLLACRSAAPPVGGVARFKGQSARIRT